VGTDDETPKSLTPAAAPHRIIVEHHFEWDKIAFGVAWTFLILCFVARIWSLTERVDES
jgi:hypothetical protein